MVSVEDLKVIIDFYKAEFKRIENDVTVTLKFLGEKKIKKSLYMNSEDKNLILCEQFIRISPEKLIHKTLKNKFRIKIGEYTYFQGPFSKIIRIIYTKLEFIQQEIEKYKKEIL